MLNAMTKTYVKINYNRVTQARLDKQERISIFARDLNHPYVTNIFRHAYR